MSNNVVLHNKLMEEGYIEAAAGKINQKLSELRESGNDRLCRRWIWELIQNANDCANPTVEIDIQHNNDTLTFSHTGKPFDYKSLMSLVTQISTKESTSKDATGKFGTGFITTHLLSEKVNIKGLFVDELNNKMNLNFLLDRSGKDIHEIKKQVINSLEALKNIHLEPNKYEDQLGNGLTTTFSYDIKDANIKALNEGKQDFDKTVFFVLAFVNTINMVRYNDTVYKKSSEEIRVNDYLKIIEIIKEVDDTTSKKKILIGFNGDIEIAVEVSSHEKQPFIEPYDSNMPKLFCKFPLVGTENYFPVVVNSSKFKVEEQRDGIYENSQVNKELILQAVKLYDQMLQVVAKNKFKNIYNMCFNKKTFSSELQKEYSKQIQQICNHTPIIYTNDGSFSSLYVKNNTDSILLIPNCDDNNIGMELWDLLNLMKNIKPIPEKETCKSWANALNPNINLEGLCNWISKFETAEKLLNHFDTKESMYQWLTKFYEIVFKYKEGECVKKYNIFINQENTFTTNFQNLYIDSNIDEALIDILSDFGAEVRNTLFSKHIKLPEISKDFEINKKNNEYIASKICEKVRRILVEETQNTKKRDEQTQKIFNKITLWFLKKPELAKEIFFDIYEGKHNLCTKEELIEKFEYAEQTKETLDRFNIPSLDKLNEWLENNANSEMYFSQYKSNDLLVGLAIDNLEELKNNNNIESVKYLLKHNPTPSVEALKKVEEIIERSKRNVINYLNSLSGVYDVGNKRELAKTVYGDIYKNGQKIKIVIRPSDSEMIILFYQSELDTLDDNNYELWIDNGIDIPRQLTFGDILMTTGIRVIPLKNLF
ncbi:hypothetical protein JDS76_27400 [Bacillus cereus]|uniref:sacsin N-terminal ATP-binding-like domain-containing protein n=1 Tax=Bacillus cereus group TaxID=86661 RepID=UPI0018F670B5|nr:MULTISPECIES: hypothetical protein [Bacillus cereus group]MBJ8090516.1 hypothetical protein [Bacillus cereus]MDY8164886.1 hypothetical protein [Bacillus thuringiensis]